MRIESYKFGEIIIEGRKYKSDLIVFPDRIFDSWWRKTGHSLSKEDIEEVLSLKPEVFIVGTGYYGLMKVPEELKRIIRDCGIELIIEKTKKAVEFYNKISPIKNTVAAFHLTC